MAVDQQQVQLPLRPLNKNDTADEEPITETKRLPFPPLTQQHILNCSFHSWYPKYRSQTPKARLILLPQPFLDYLRADGIFLPSDDPEASSESDEEPSEDVAKEWRPLHNTIQSTIAELGGKVMPKLNWSAPKDATHMLGNTMECREASDVYILLKSSDFISFDLDHAFEDTVDDGSQPEIPYHLVLRKAFNLNPSVEFRVFVKREEIVGICQRDLNYYDFLAGLKGKIQTAIYAFFEKELETFEDENFVFDVYVPEPYNRVWLIDINPWAQRTDPLLFSWLELLGDDAEGEEDEILDEEEEVDEELLESEFRLVQKNDPEAYGFYSQQYSAHKMPKDVVDASQANEDEMREFSERWKEVLERAQKEDAGYESSDK